MQLFFLEPKAQILTTKKVNVYRRFPSPLQDFANCIKMVCTSNVFALFLKLKLIPGQKKVL